MTKQVICYGLLHTQRKAAIKLFHLHMLSLAQIILSDESVDVAELFMHDIQNSTNDISDRMKYFINDSLEQFPHVSEPFNPEKTFALNVQCRFCGIGLGWACPKNPNGYCEYSQESDNAQDWEICIHCGHPEERK